MSRPAVSCPRCYHPKAWEIHPGNLCCTQCGYTLKYPCPYCQNPLPDDEHDPVSCPSCVQSFSLSRVQDWIEEGWLVSGTEKCSCRRPLASQVKNPAKKQCPDPQNCHQQLSLFEQGGEKKESYIFLDFETTGLNIGKDNIIEIGAVKASSTNEVETFQRLIKPTHSISDRIEGITGITDDMVKDAPPLKAALEEFAEFCADSTIVAHNADFDIPWLLTSNLRHHIQPKSKSVICTLLWARKQKESRCSLGALTQKYQVAHANAHRALADAMATKDIFFIYKTKSKVPPPSKSLSDYLPLSQRLVSTYSDYVQP